MTAVQTVNTTQFAQTIHPFDPKLAVSPVFRQGVASFTPAIAKEILANHVAPNRRLGPVTSRRYRDDIVGGAWTFAGDPLRFDVDGNLIDGQHRLLALSQVKDPLFSMVFTVMLGLPYEAIRAMDQGAKRTSGQQLNIAGVKNAQVIGAGARLAILWEQGTPKSGYARVVSNPRVEQWVRENPELVEHVNSHMTKIKQTDLPGGAATAAALILAQVDPDAELEFFTLLSDGGTPKGNPINTLDKRLARLRRHNTQTRAEEYLALTFKAWNAWRQGRELHQITKLGENESFPSLV